MADAGTPLKITFQYPRLTILKGKMYKTLELLLKQLLTRKFFLNRIYEKVFLN